MHEHFLRAPLSQIWDLLQEEQRRGEMVLLIAPPDKPVVTDEQITQALNVLIGTQSLKDAVQMVAEGLDVGRKRVYNLALRIGSFTL
jgi:16S rRNA (cytidine1402-2'-O)-methyltransferase